MASRKKSLTDADREAHKRLRRLWDVKKRDLHLTQEQVADLWGVTQGAVSQYLNGHTKLGVVATLRFSKLLGVRPQDIRPDFEYSALVPGELPPEAIEMAVAWMSLPKVVRDDLKRTMETLAESNYAKYLERVTHVETPH